MLNPSYGNLIEVLNRDAGVDQKITSRYSIVIAAAKRARQIVGGAAHEDLSHLGIATDKAVSIAINEIYQGYVKMVPKTGVGPLSDHDHVVQNMPTLIDDSFVMAEEFDDFNVKKFGDDDDIDDADGDGWDDDDEDEGEDDEDE